jgi:hypothetical protein
MSRAEQDRITALREEPADPEPQKCQNPPEGRTMNIGAARRARSPLGLREAGIVRELGQNWC